MSILKSSLVRSMTAFEGKDDTLGATGYVNAEGRQQLSEDAIAKLDEVYEAMKAGEIVPASNWNGYLPTDFPGLK